MIIDSQQTIGKKSVNAGKQKNTDLFFFKKKNSIYDFFEKMALKLFEFLEKFMICSFFDKSNPI